MRLSPGCVECSLCGVSRLGSLLAVQSLFSRWLFHWLLCLGGRASSREIACEFPFAFLFEDDQKNR